MSESVITFSRYVFNSLFVTAVGTAGMVLISSLAAFALAKYRLGLRKVLFNIVVFVPDVFGSGYSHSQTT